MKSKRVTAISHWDGSEVELLNVSTSPTLKYQKTVILPPNLSDVNEIHIYELFLNNISQDLFVEIVVLNKALFEDLWRRLKALDDMLNWNTFDFDYDQYYSFPLETLTIEELINMLVAIENAIEWGTYNKPHIDGKYKDSLGNIIKRIEICEAAVLWDYEEDLTKKSPTLMWDGNEDLDYDESYITDGKEVEMWLKLNI